MKFTDSQLKDITSKIDSKCGDFKCPICGSKEIGITPECVHLLSLDESEAIDNRIASTLGEFQKCASVMCENCGYVMLFKVNI